MKIIVIGYGLLGKSIVDVLKQKNEIVLIETNKLSDIADHHDADGIVICANTDLFEILEKIPIFLPILIRSDISPDTVDKIHNQFSEHSIVIFPVLSDLTKLNDDLENQKYVILGGEDPECFWQDLLQASLPKCNLVFTCSDKEAALIKYATEGFLAIKLSYFNQLYDLCSINALDFNIVRQILNHDPRIGTNNTMVLNSDGKRGLNITDTLQEFLEWSNTLETPLTTLLTAIEYNAKLRKNI